MSINHGGLRRPLLAMAGCAGLFATAAHAAQPPELVVQRHNADARSVAVEVADLDLDRAYDRDTLTIRVEKAARAVCDVNGGSKVDRQADALDCLDQARRGAWAQLERRGVDTDAVMAAGGGMR